MLCCTHTFRTSGGFILISQKISNKVIVLLALLCAGYLAWSYAFPSYTVRYKMTVTVETPEGLKSGSAVREVTNRDNTFFGIKFPDVGVRISRVKGEAVVIDLGNRGVLFALIDNGSYGELYSAFSVNDPSNTTDDFKKLKLGMSAPLLKQDWPMFVTFKDIKDPKSVVLLQGRRFDPKIQDMVPVYDVEKVLGSGVRIQKIAIDVVSDSVSWGGVSKYLPDAFWQTFDTWWNEITATEKMKYVRLFSFKTGEQENE